LLRVVVVLCVEVLLSFKSALTALWGPEKNSMFNEFEQVDTKTY
jgi:hypothetical protein